MKRIQMVDLEAQTARIRPEIDRAIARVLDSSKFIGGDEVNAFSEELGEQLDGAFVTTCANGTDALQIALMAMGVGPGDEVIVPTFTFISPVEVIALLGAKPVLVDVYPDTFNIDCEAVEAAITDRTKVVLPVHLFGQCADMGKLLKIVKKHDLHILEDTAQSLMSIYCDNEGLSGKAGTFWGCGTTSFFPSKNLGCFGDGGAIITHSLDFASLLETIANHGSDFKYEHECVGVNSRLDAVQAAILRVKLKHLKEYNKARLEAANRYDELLKNVVGVTIPFRDARSSHVFHQYTVTIDPFYTSNEKVQTELKLADIPTAIYYPTPIHLQKGYGWLDYRKGDFPVSEKLSQTVLSLPMHTELSAEQQEYIVERLKATLAKWI
jgi:UDP-2-acetamido-2-deoxy-ribo-hexuluronate aminotransferase